MRSDRMGMLAVSELMLSILFSSFPSVADVGVLRLLLGISVLPRTLRFNCTRVGTLTTRTSSSRLEGGCDLNVYPGEIWRNK